MSEKVYIDPTDWSNRYAVEVELYDRDDFSKITETLTRIGIANNAERTLTQTCHLFYRGNKYYLVHFKELFILDCKPVNIDPEDILRRNRIINLLEEWGLIRVKPEFRTRIENQALSSTFRIIPFRDKSLWNLKTKYQIGLR